MFEMLLQHTGPKGHENQCPARVLELVRIDCPHRTLCDGTSFYCYFGTDC